jgi:glucose/arabinose dehydrogenase
MARVCLLTSPYGCAMLHRAAFLLIALALLAVPAEGHAAAGDPFDSGAADQLMAAAAPSLPAGFTDTTVWSGLVTPTTLRWAPDGRVFVALKSGIVNVYDSVDDPTPTVYADLRTNVFDFFDRGLLGLAVDPQYSQGRPYIYVLYSYDKDPNSAQFPRWNDNCPNPPGADGDGCVTSARLSRIDPDGTEHVLITDWCNHYSTHTIGALNFGPDGALYASSGDGASYIFADYGQGGSPENPCGDPPAGVGGDMTPPTAAGGALRSQSFRRAAGQPVSLDGSIIRVNPDTGAAMPDNPAAGDANANRRRIVAYGMRNPYRFTFRPGTSEMWFGDVGWNTWEEVNRIPDTTSVRNYGWPCYEGDARMPAYDTLNLNLCESLYSAGTATGPHWDYAHGATLPGTGGCPAGTSSVTGVAFYTGTQFPAQYRNALFIADYARRCVIVMRADANGVPDPATVQTFEADAAGPVDLQQGPDGRLYYVDLEGGAIHRIAYPAGNNVPTARATATPDHGPVPLNVAFDGSASSDPDGGALTYSWDLNGDGTFGDATIAKPAFTYTTPGTYTVRLRVTDPVGGTDTVTVPITAGDPPVATIASPTAAFTWAVGDVISYAGSAVDGQGNPIAPSGLAWQLNILHCARTDASNCHTHPGSTVTGVASGTMIAPNHDYPSRLQLVLTATDAHGLKATKTVTLDPKTVDLTLASNPAGAELTMGADTGTGPFTQRFIQNATTDITAPSPQTIGGAPYEFEGWSDGGGITHTITVPQSDTTYTATFKRITEFKLAGADVVGGNTSQAVAGRAEVYRTTGAVTGSATKLRLYVDPTSTATRLGLGLYADNNGEVGPLLRQGTTTTVTPGAWNEVTLSSAVPITAGTAYWIGLINPSSGTGILRWRDNAGAAGGAEQTSATSTLPELPATWATGGRFNDGPVSAYAVGPPAGPAPGPELSVTPTSLAFSGVAGGAAPAAKNLTVSNIGGGSLNYTASDDASWMSVSPTSGPAAQDVTVTLDTSGLAAGTYNGTVTVSAAGAAGSPKLIPVTLTLTPPAPPSLMVSPTSLSFSATAGGPNPAAQSLAIANGGSGTLSYSATDDASWLSLTPASGSAPGNVSASVDAAGLAAGTYTATVTITSAGTANSPQTVPVTLTVAPPGGELLGGANVIGTSTSSAPVGAAEAYRLSATTTGTTTKLRLYVDGASAATRLTLGLYGDAGGNPSSLLSSGTITSVTAGAWNEVTLATPVPVTAGTNYWFALLNPTGSGGTLRWRDHAGGSGGAEQTSAGRTLGALPTTWARLASYTDGPVSGTLWGVTAPPPSPVLAVAPSSLAFSVEAGAANPAAKTVSVTNTGGGTLSFSASDDAPWLSVTPASGTAPRDLSVAVDASGLAPGTYTGAVTVTAAGVTGSPKTVPVTLTVTAPAPPALAVAPASLSFAGETGGANPATKTLSVTNTGGGTLSFSASDDAPWLSLTPATGSAPRDLTVTASISGLAAGTHTATVTVDGGSAGTKTIPVTLTLTAPPPPALAVTPGTLAFSATQGGAAPPAQPISVANTGSGSLPFTVTDDASWLSAAPASGTANATVNVSVDPTGLAPGTYTGTVTVNGGGAGTKTVAVTLAVSAPATGLVGAWGFDETTGTTTTDASGKGNTGTISGAVRTTAGKFGSALTFDGVNDWVTVADAATLRLTTGATIEGWMRPAANGSARWRTLAIKERGAGLSYALYGYGDAGLPSGHAFTSVERWARAPSAPALNTWTHLAMTYDGTTIRLYVNGTQAATQAQTGSLAASTGPLRFGGNAVWPEWFQGQLDEIRVYNRALTAAELQADMTRPVSAASVLAARATASRATKQPAARRRAGERRANPGVQRLRYRAKRAHDGGRLHPKVLKLRRQARR